MTPGLGPAPPVSIVIPTFGRPDFLERAIASVREQTCSDWNLWVVDDNDPGSDARQDTEAVMARVQADGRIQYHQQDRNLGACVARNTGAARSESKFLAFLDDDDAWLPTKLERQLAKFATASDDVALIYTGHRRIFDGPIPDIDILPHFEGRVLNELLNGNFIGTTSSIMLRRTAFDTVGGFDTAYPANQDYDLYMRLAQHYAIARVPEVLTLSYRHSSGNIGRDTDAKLKAFDLMLEHHATLFQAAPDARIAQVRRMAKRLVHRGRGPDARRVLRHGLRSGPIDVRLLVLWGLSYWPPSFTHRVAALRRRARGTKATTSDG